MTEQEKATATLDYLEGLDSKCVINLLNPYLDDNELALLYDQLVEDGCIKNEPDDDTDPTLKAALDYVREQIDEDELEVMKATVTRNLSHRAPVSAGINDGWIIDLLEEYGEDNDLPEGWWEEHGDIEDILMML